MASVLLVVLGCSTLVIWGIFCVASVKEGERRAAGIAGGLAVGTAAPVFLLLLLPTHLEWLSLCLLAGAAATAVLLLFLPVGHVDRGDEVPKARVDERDIMFARAGLEPGTPNHEAYYAMRPENRASDDWTRHLPGLLSPRSSGYHTLAFASAEASFALTQAVRDAVDGPTAPDLSMMDAEAMTAFVQDLTRYYGAHSVGVTELHDYHVYTHIGRGSGKYGAPVHLEHRYAIAFTVEMQWELVSTAPWAPTVMESARQYVEAAKIALQLASFIRQLGYPARAHIDGNYRIIAPLVARDAALGSIGRMGLLMTPTLGPRVRLGVVTTDLPLLPAARWVDTSALDFCRVCEKCADCCPIHAIPKGDRQEIDGVLRWRINADLCFRYWNATGSDCGRCMAVCPYSRPDVLAHNVVRWAVRRSGAARRAAVWLDGVFYGAVPRSKPYPGWIPRGTIGR